MLVSIIINNFNYGRYVGEAIESALQQTHNEVEVVIVDDGSTDNSREYIDSFGTRIKAIYKNNGGQASALNAGFAASEGEIVGFLDADDLLLPHAVARVLELWSAETVKAHFPMVRIDAKANVIGTEPRDGVTLPSGIVWPDFVRFGRYTTPATSGSFYARRALSEVFPIPEGPYVRAADAFLNNTLVFFGPFVATDEPLGAYRVHGSNSSLGNVLTTNMERVRFLMRREVANDEAFVIAARKNGHEIDPNVRYRYYQRLKMRTLSWKADREHHPMQGDSLIGLLTRANVALWQVPGLGLRERLLQSLWFAVVLLGPKSLGLWMIHRSNLLKKLVGRSRDHSPDPLGSPYPLPRPACYRFDAPLVSVVITNYNYAKFVNEAIECVLNQTYRKVELIVVDDGSKDNSREIIESFGDRIQSVFKQNGGLGSAFNAGYVPSKGDIVIFLDADDLLHPYAIEKLVANWDRRAVKTHFLLTRRNSLGEAIGTEPRDHRSLPGGKAWLPSGDLSRILVTEGRYLTTATTGNAYSRWALEKVMPVPEEEYRQAADAYLNNCIVFHGPVQAINESLGIYRIHGSNDSLGNVLSADVARMRYLMARECANDATMLRAAEFAKVKVAPEVRYRFYHRLKLRILSWKIDRPKHPKNDSWLSLAKLAVDAVWLAPGLTIGQRAIQSFWCFALLSFPRVLVLQMVANNAPVKRLLKLGPSLRQGGNTSANAEKV